MSEHVDHVMTVGEPGAGKSVAGGHRIVNFPGPVWVNDPQQFSVGRFVMEQTPEADLLVDQLDRPHGLGHGLFQPSTSTDQSTRRKENLASAQFFASMSELRGGTPMGSTPLKQEWYLTAVMAVLSQSPPMAPEMVPYALRPDSDEFAAIVRGCTDPECRHKISGLAALSPRALKTETGSATRAIGGLFLDECFVNRCRPGNLLGHLRRRRARVVIEGGKASPELKRLVICGSHLRLGAMAEAGQLLDPTLVFVDEATSADVAGRNEEDLVAMTRKYHLYWHFAVQYPNFSSGNKGFFQNCQRKEAFRSSFEVARMMAPFFAGTPGSEESRSSRIDAIATDITNLAPGWRYVVDRKGVRKEYVPMLENPWPDWPGLREAKLQEKLCRIYQRPEYRTGGGGDTTSARSSPPETPPPTNSKGSSSAADRLKKKRNGEKPTDGSAKN